jgi:hypothetical protein
MNLSSLKSIGNDGATLEPLGGFQRTKESSIGAVGNVLGGVGQVITGTNGRFRGLLRVGEGVFDALDIVPSAIADGVRMTAGTPSKSHTPSGFHTVRAFRHASDIRTDNVVNGVLDTGAVVVDNIHAIGFKLGSDILRLMRGAK